MNRTKETDGRSHMETSTLWLRWRHAPPEAASNSHPRAESLHWVGYSLKWARSWETGTRPLTMTSS